MSDEPLKPRSDSKPTRIEDVIDTDTFAAVPPWQDVTVDNDSNTSETAASPPSTKHGLGERLILRVIHWATTGRWKRG